jgi:hypothetical protein
MCRVLWDFGDGHSAVRRRPDRTQHGPGRSRGASPPVHVFCSRSASATPIGAHPDQPGSLSENGRSGWSTRRRFPASAHRPQLGQRPRRRSSRPRRAVHLGGSHLLLARGGRRESQHCLGQGSSVDHRQRSPSLPFEQQRRLRTSGRVRRYSAERFLPQTRRAG